VLWVHDEAVAVRDESGRPLYWQGIWLDITEQKRATEGLREAESKYRALIEQLPAITYLDPIDEEGDSIYISPQVETILGGSVEAWMSTPNYWASRVYPDDLDRVWDVYVEHRRTGEPMAQEYRMVREDGGMVWVREEATILLDGSHSTVGMQRLEGIPIAEDYGIYLFDVETRPWPRFGMKGAACHLKGRGDFTNMFLFEVPPGGSSTPQRHLYEEVIYVLEGEGALHIAGESAPLRPGTCIHLPAQLVHCLENTGPGEMQVLGVFRPAGSPAEAYYPDGTRALY
jgi:PAS domain S-box-containing protein